MAGVEHVEDARNKYTLHYACLHTGGNIATTIYGVNWPKTHYYRWIDAYKDQVEGGLPQPSSEYVEQLKA